MTLNLCSVLGYLYCRRFVHKVHAAIRQTVEIIIISLPLVAQCVSLETMIYWLRWRIPKQTITLSSHYNYYNVQRRKAVLLSCPPEFVPQNVPPVCTPCLKASRKRVSKSTRNSILTIKIPRPINNNFPTFHTPKTAPLPPR